MKELLEKKKIEKEILKRKLKKLFFPMLILFTIVNGTCFLFFIEFLVASGKTYLEFFLLLFNTLFTTQFIKRACYQAPTITKYITYKKEISKQEFYLENQKIFEQIDYEQKPFQEIKPITFETSTTYKLKVLKEIKEGFLSLQVNQITGDYPNCKKKTFK